MGLETGADVVYATAIATWVLLSLLLCWRIGRVVGIGPLASDGPTRDGWRLPVTWVVVWTLGQVWVGLVGLLCWLQWRAPRARRAWFEGVRAGFLVFPVACLGAGLGLYLSHHQVTWSQATLLVPFPLATTATVTLIGYGAILAVRLQRPLGADGEAGAGATPSGAGAGERSS